MDKGKKIGLQMGLLMSVTLSLFLSATGLISAGQFSVPALLINFAVSFVISMIISVLIPMHKVTAAADRKFGFQPGRLGTRFFETLLSDLIYTPILTFAMVTIAYRHAISQVSPNAPAGAGPKYGPMLLKGMIISLIVGYVLIFIFMPLYLKLVMKKNGVGPMGPGAGMGPNAGMGPGEGRGPRE